VQTDLCVGDRVEFRHTADERRERDELVRVLPRRTVLLRREPRTRTMRAVAANVDAVVIVVSVVSPPLHPRLIDRYLIAIEHSWVDRTRATETALADAPDPAQPVIAVNKVDLLDTLPKHERAAELARLDAYRAMGVPVVECSAARAHGLDDLRRALAGKTVVLVGHSGVGKSSLANALDPRLGARVGAIGTAANRGTHTTTTAQMYELAGVDGLPGFRVIDTPGIRSFGLDDLSEAELRDSFPELRALRRSCRFNDCTHTHEPDCAVRDAVDAGTLHPERYETYRRLLEEIRRPEGYLPTQRIRVKPEEDEDGASE
jgi:ribosome small subunit-dependent GTPase A